MRLPPLAGPSSLLQAAFAAFIAVVASAGLYYLWSVGRVAWHALRAPKALAEGENELIVLGKRLEHVEGRWVPDHEFVARLERARQIASTQPALRIIVSGGGVECTEAEAGLLHLRAHGVSCLIELESSSTSTLENFILCRALLRSQAPAVVSSRYHLARCQVLSKKLGLQPVFIGAEERFAWSWRSFKDVAREAGFLVVWDFWRAPSLMRKGAAISQRRAQPGCRFFPKLLP